MLKSAPVIEIEFTVTGEVPFDVRVNGCVAAVFTVTLPKLKLVALRVNCGFATIMVYAADPTALAVYPPAVPIALIVSGEETVSGPE
jgi:glycerol uptake facilitator-like aquaporin